MIAAGAGAAGAATGTPGTLDPTFGTDGISLTAPSGAGVSDAILQPNGDIVVADQHGLIRFRPNGVRDTTFGTGGVASTTAFNDLGNGPSGVALQPNGDLIWIGDTTNNSTGVIDFAIARFTSSGTLDPSFGTDGQATTEFFADPLAGATELAESVLVQPDGAILVGGVARQGQNKAAPYLGALVRFTASGALDPTFGTGGQVLSASLGSISSTTPGQITALGLDAAGDIFVLPRHAELSSAGQIDASVTPAAITSSETNGPAAFLPSGEYVIGQTVGVGKHDDVVQVQYFNASGTLAASSPEFHYSGTTGEDGVNTVAIQPNGQTVVGGSRYADGIAVFGLARVNTNGSLDTTFGNSGTVTTDIQGDEGVGALAILPDGEILAAGSSEDNSTGVISAALALYFG